MDTLVAPSRAAAEQPAFVVPESLRAVARFPVDGGPEARAAVWVEVLALAARELAAEARTAGSWSAESRSRAARRIDEGSRVLAAAKAPILAAEERAGAWRATGARRYEDFLARESRSGRGTARREAQAARTVEELEGGHEALVDGTLTPSHVDRLGTVLGKLPEEKRELLLSGEGAERVKKLARRHDATSFGPRLESLAASLSPREAEERHQSARSRRFLELTPTAEGMTRVTGLLDPVAGHTLRLALDAASPRPGEDDDRTPAQRSADALTSIATNALHEAKAGGSARAQVLVTMTAETFVRAKEHLKACSHASALQDEGSGVGRTDGTRGGPSATSPGHGGPGSLSPDHPGSAGETPDRLGLAPAVRLQDGPVLPPSELGRLLCDSEVARLVIGAESEPLDLGRSVRLFSPAQRRAVIARDQGCFWDGCSIPSRYCEVHHLDWWDEDAGHTDVTRGVLACTFHHGLLHAQKLDVRTVDELRDTIRARRRRPDGAARGEPPPELASESVRLPGDPDYEPPRYRTVPRSSTKKERSARTSARLLAEARRGAEERRARRVTGQVHDGEASLSRNGETLLGRDGEASLSRNIRTPLDRDGDTPPDHDGETSQVRAGVVLGHDGEKSLGRAGAAPPGQGRDVAPRREAQPMLDIDTPEREAG